MPEFYMIFARKIFSRFFGGASAPAPRLLRLCLCTAMRSAVYCIVFQQRHVTAASKLILNLFKGKVSLPDLQVVSKQTRR